MVDKTQIIDELGYKELLLPRLIGEALSANDRTKYFFSLLQTAKSRAESPDDEFSNLKTERQASGVQDSAFDSVVEQSCIEGERYRIPLSSRILEEIKAGMQAMMAPLPDPESYRHRVEALARQLPTIDNDVLPGIFVDMLTSVRRDSDSFHLVVMDMHKELNRLQAEIYQESIYGASIYGISEDSDKLLVKAFMAGVNETAKLKFDHPGLGTTATKTCDDLVIQNDIGMTDAHVLVIRIKDLLASLTYTDVHVERLAFFQSLFASFDVQWSDARSKKSKELEEGMYYLSTGTYAAKDRADLESYLAFLGSKIVFLIDWNRARKRLRNFVKKDDAISVLKWAADNGYGHMAFLKLGGENLIFDAIERTPKAQLRYGQEFHEVLGSESAVEFLKFALRASAEGLLENRSELLIRDEIRAELSKYFHSIHESLLEVARAHATLIVDISMSARDAVMQLGGTQDPEFLARSLKNASRQESGADSLLNKGRDMIKRVGAPPIVERLLGTADDAADSLEEAIFLLTLAPQGSRLAFYDLLRELAELACQSSMEYLKAVECARIIRRSSSREEMDDFLAAVDRTLTIEHQADDIYRATKTSLLSSAQDFRQLHLFGELAARIEQSADSLMKAAIMLRDYILEDVVTG